MSLTTSKHTSNNPNNENAKVDRRGLTEAEAAVYIGCSRSTLRQGRMEGRRKGHFPCPPHVKLGRKILYLRDDLDRWLEENRQGINVA